MRFLCRCGRWLCTTCPDPASVDVGRRFFLQAGLLVPVAASVTVAQVVEVPKLVFKNGSVITLGGLDSLGEYTGGLEYVWAHASGVTFAEYEGWRVVGAGTPKGGG